MQPTGIAIIGLACRFPTVVSPGDLWDLLRDGREAAGSIDNVADFDADFFNLSPREASAMDPRQRLALELTWELLEDAFVVPETLRGQPIAVYLGAMNDDYAVLTLAADRVDHHAFAGTSRAIIANRVSFAFGLRGPSVTIDSGQSSSLVAVHLACESVRTGEAPLAIAGGVHLNLARETAMLEQEFGAVSPSGHTYAFDERADGYVPGDGGGLVLLKPVQAALDDGDRIHAIIRGSAVGNAGHSATGLTVPSVAGQVDVIRRAMSGAGVDCHQVHYVEAHGTGTKIGDPIEARALGEIFAARQRRPVSVGSVKTNIGHTGGAAGIAGLLKAVLAIENAVIPPSLNYVGAAIDLDSLGLRVDTALTPWPVADEPRRAGVSSFGMGGTNAHVILEQGPTQSPEIVESVAAAGSNAPVAVPWVLAARSPQALTNQAGRLLAHLTADDGLTALDVGWSLVKTRAMFEHRAVVVGADRGALLAGLAALAAGESGAGVAVGRARSVGKTVFVFPGQGAQWVGMGAQLYAELPLFALAFDAVAEELDRHLRLPLRNVLWEGDEALLTSTEFAQPALFAIEVALATLLQHWGISPDFLIGHSVGEIAAAHLAGVLSLTDAAGLVAARGRLMAELPAGGVMVVVAASEEEVLPVLVDGANLAAVNAPHSVVVSGCEAAVSDIADHFARRGRRVHRLAVSHAFHSLLMEPMLAEFTRIAAGISVSKPRIPLVSNVTGQMAGAGYGDGQYWVEHARRPVRFAEGVQLLNAVGATRFVEVGPGGGLTALVEQSLPLGEALSVAMMRREHPEVSSVLGAVATLFTAGAQMDWPAVFGSPGRRIELPTYAFQRQRYWLPPTSAGSADISGVGLLAARHGLLGAVVEQPDSDVVVLTGRLSVGEQRWLADHVIAGVVLLAGAAFVELALRAADQVDCGVVEELTVVTPLVLPTVGGVQLQVVVGVGEMGQRPVSIYSRNAESDSGWVLHARGVLGAKAVAPAADLSVWPPLGAAPVDVDGAYQRFAELGYEYGRAFQGLTAMWRRESELFADVAVPDDVDVTLSGFGIHPLVLDAALHAMGMVGEQAATMLPFSWQGVSLHAAGASRVRARIAPAGDGTVSVELADQAGLPVLSVQALVMRSVSSQLLSAAVAAADAAGRGLLEVAWLPVELAHNDISADLVVWELESFQDGVGPVYSATHRVLVALQSWLAQERAGRLVVLTQGSVGQDATNLAGAAVWGLVRSAQAEHPGRVMLVDSDGSMDVGDVIGCGEEQLMIRNGTAYAARLAQLRPQPILQLPDTNSGWRLVAGGAGTLEDLTLASCPAKELAPGQVRIEVRALGVNFRDVLVALGIYPGAAELGAEGAGVVTEVGPGVTGLAVGDPVMGLLGVAGSEAVVDARLVVKLPN
uniref:type I polyketide synthase n=36 Tax=Mycobacterium tuberculosis TaxID=1773 RepID=UPI00131F0652